MDVKLSERKCTVAPEVKAYAEKKVGKLERYFRGDAEALVTFRMEKRNCRVELTVHASNTYFRAEETTTDMMASIDAAVATIEGQIRKNKTRLAQTFAHRCLYPHPRGSPGGSHPRGFPVPGGAFQEV